ncbi:MAG: TIGR00266 family protein [Thermoplasmata archaeon]|nr:TIGR00266 family protein [Thermoplasmata archaeon]
MKHTITGDNLQFVNCEIMPGELLFAEAGTMTYMSSNISMTARARGGLMAGLKRKMTGESFFVTEFTAAGGTGVVAFAGNVPGKIQALDLRGGKTWLVQKDAFLCAEGAVTLDIAFQKKLGTIFFGGEGLIIQKLTGEGTTFVHGSGDFIEMNLKPGEIIRVSTGNVVAWEGGVQYSIESVGSIRSALFSGEGLFVTTLTGPGRVILQSLTLPKLAGALVPFLPRQQSSGSGFNLR